MLEMLVSCKRIGNNFQHEVVYHPRVPERGLTLFKLNNLSLLYILGKLVSSQ